MRSKKIFCTILVLVSFCSFVSAVPVTTLHWLGHSGGIGGYYQSPPINGIGYGEIYPHGNWSCELIFDAVYNLPGYADGSELITFCLEWDEPLIGESDFTADISLEAWGGGADSNTGDPLDTESAWLYNEYLDGNTFGITDLNHRAAVVQEAIWSFEGELDSSWALYSETSNVKQTAINAVAAGWVNTNIRVLNVYWQDGGKSGQDVLCRIPEPTTILILAAGAILLRKKTA